MAGWQPGDRPAPAPYLLGRPPAPVRAMNAAYGFHTCGAAEGAAQGAVLTRSIVRSRASSPGRLCSRFFDGWVSTKYADTWLQEREALVAGRRRVSGFPQATKQRKNVRVAGIRFSGAIGAVSRGLMHSCSLSAVIDRVISPTHASRSEAAKLVTH